MAQLHVDFLDDYSDAAILDELRRIAAVRGGTTVTKRDIEEVGKLSYAVVNRRFGSLRAALQRAGLRPTRFMKATQAELLAILLELWGTTIEKYGRRPFKEDLAALSYPVGADTFVRKFGSWKTALIRASDSVIEKSIDLEPPSDIVEPTARGGRSLSLRKRFFVFKRDKYTCVLCGRSGVPLEVNHKVARTDCGSDALDNLQTLCFDCNRGKRDSAH